jgi:hypothetical protein
MPFAVGGDWGKGRVLVMADHSVFINNMMLQNDNGNYDFACNCLAWLKSDPQRTKVLFVDEGTIVTDFKVPFMHRPLGMPEGADFITYANSYIAELEHRNFFNNVLEHYVSYESILQALAVALTLGLLTYGVSRLMRARRRIELAAPLLAPALTTLVPVGPGLTDRHTALLAEGNLWAQASDLALAFFGRALPGHAVHATLPPCKIKAGWLRARAARQQLERIWRLAHGHPMRVSPAEFTRIAADIAGLKTLLADGTLVWQAPERGA